MISSQPSKRVKLAINNISKNFAELPVLDNISLNVNKNELVTLLGPSGSGKTTLFNIVAGLICPDKGHVLIDDKDFTGKTGRVSYMYQKDLLMPWRKVIDNVTLLLIIQGINKKEARTKAEPFFKVFGLEGFEDKYPFQLSGGMRQRAALMRTYMFSKDIILLDEPFGGLDAITKSKMQYWLLSVHRQINTSILLITHDIEEAILLSDRIYLLSERPAKIKDEIIVDLSPERTNETKTSPRFIEIKKHILELLE